MDIVKDFTQVGFYLVPNWLLSISTEYDKAAKSLGGVVNIGRVNCDNEKDLAGRFGIKGFPTIKVFPAFKSSKQNPEDYQGARESGSIVNTALSLLKSIRDPVKNFESEDELKQFISESSPENARAILFSGKTANPNLFKSIAIEFTSKRVEFGFVGGDKFLETFGIEGTPALLIFKSGSIEESIRYSGPLKKKEMVEFIEANIAKGEPAPAPRKKKASTHTVTIVEDQETFSKKCEKTCVIGFVGGEKQVATFNELNSKYPEQTFVQVNSGTSAFSNLRTVFELDPSSGENMDIVVLRGHKLKYAAKQQVSLSEASLLLDRVIGGDQVFKSLTEFPVISAQQKDEL